MRNILGLVTGHGLLTVTGNDHKQMRKAMNPAFSIANLTARTCASIHHCMPSLTGLAETDMYYEAIDGYELPIYYPDSSLKIVLQSQ